VSVSVPPVAGGYRVNAGADGDVLIDLPDDASSQRRIDASSSAGNVTIRRS
jgi:hypothetical protein